MQIPHRLSPLAAACKQAVVLLGKYSEDEPRDEEGRWTDGGGGQSKPTPGAPAQFHSAGTWTNPAPKLASEISGHTPDVPLQKLTLYHVTRTDRVGKIIAGGFNLAEVSPRWINDYAVSFTPGSAESAARYFARRGEPVDESKYALLKVSVRGRFAGDNVNVPANDAHEFTRNVIGLGYDGQDLGRSIYLHNPRAVLSIEHVPMPKVRGKDGPVYLKDGPPDEARDDHGRWTSGGGSMQDAPQDTMSGMWWSHLSEERKDKLREGLAKRMRNELDKAGMGSYPVRFEHQSDSQFSVAGEQRWDPAGMFRPDGAGGELVFFTDNLLQATNAQTGVARHEAFHARFNYALNTTGAFLEPSQRQADVKRFILDNGEALRKENGSTQYARSYWKKLDSYLNAGRPTAQIFKDAVNESLAEMHAHGGVKDNKPIYKQLDDLVSKHWASSRWAKKQKAHIKAGPPDEARDDHGRWTSGGASVDEPSDAASSVYHGTGADVLNRVLREGLKPGDEWFDRPGSVYMAVDEKVAAEYAFSRAEAWFDVHPNAKSVEGVVFKLRKPPDAKRDTEQKDESYYVSRRISPKDIIAYRTFSLAKNGELVGVNFSSHPSEWHNLRKTAGDYVYVVRFSDEGKKSLLPVVTIKRVATLYVSRPVLNVKQISDWAKANGFKTTLDDMHVTLAYSTTPVDWQSINRRGVPGKITIENSKRYVERLGDQGAIVLGFESKDLTSRWQEFVDQGANWDYPNYNPHVTLSYVTPERDLAEITPYDGPIELGPEQFAKVDTEKEKIEKYSEDQARDDHGRWTSGGSEANLAEGSKPITPHAAENRPLRTQDDIARVIFAEVAARDAKEINLVLRHEAGPPIEALKSIGVDAKTAASFTYDDTGTTAGLITVYAPSFINQQESDLRSALRHEIAHAKFEYADREKGVFWPFLDANENRLASEGLDVSRYASEWWQRFDQTITSDKDPQTGRVTFGRGDLMALRSAVNETFAELHAKSSSQAWNDHPTYSKLNDLVSEVWNKDAKHPPAKDVVYLEKYNEDQARDDHGRWTSEGAGRAERNPAGGDLQYPEREPTAAELNAAVKRIDRIARAELAKLGMSDTQFVVTKHNYSENKPFAYFSPDSGKITFVARASYAFNDKQIAAIARHEAAHVRFDIANAVGGFGLDGFILNREKQLRREGERISPYARSWWAVVPLKSERNNLTAFGASPVSAANEALADAHGKNSLDKFPAYKALNNEVQRLYTQQRGKGVVYLEKYSEDQPRDDHGRWTDFGGGGSISERISHLAGKVLDKLGAAGIPLLVLKELPAEVVEAVHATLGHLLESFLPAAEALGAPASALRMTGSQAGLLQEAALHTGVMLLVAPVLADRAANTVEGIVHYETSKLKFAYAERNSSEVRQFLADAKEGLSKQDGVTAYSRAWWNYANKKKDDFSYHHAVRTTLAEIARTRAGESFSRQAFAGHPTYLQLQNRVNKIWAESKWAKPLAAVGIRSLEKYSEDQARDDHGRWTDDGGGGTDTGVTVYHGTANTYIDSVKKEGLVLHPPNRTYDEPFLYAGDRGESVFVTTSRDHAEMWARSAATAAEVRGKDATPLVLTIHLPDAVAKQLMPDTEAQPEVDRVSSVSIKPEWITDIAAGIAPAFVHFQSLAKADAGLKTLYLTVLIQEPLGKGFVNKYSEDQARDEHGRWTSGGSSGAATDDRIKFYHGTSSEALDSIRKNGLVAKGGHGASEWAKVHGYESLTYADMEGSRALSVFVTPRKDIAGGFAKLAAEVTNTTPVTLTLEIPTKEYQKLSPHQDEYSRNTGIRLEGKIKPEWITNYSVSKQDSQVLYAVFLCKDDASKSVVHLEKDGPEDEARDDHGRWTSGGSTTDVPKPQRGWASNWQPLSPSLFDFKGKFDGTVVDAKKLSDEQRALLQKQVDVLAKKLAALQRSGDYYIHAHSALNFALGVLEVTKNEAKGLGGIVAIAKDGSFRGGAMFHQGNNKRVELDYLGSLQRGAGGSLMKEVERYARDVYHANTLFLSPTEFAIPFYKKQGYKQVSFGRLEKDLRTKSVAIEDDEPIGVLALSDRLASKLHLKYSEDQARDDHGRWTSEGGSSSEAKPLTPEAQAHAERVARALATYKPVTDEMRAIAFEAQRKVAVATGGTVVSDNGAVDVVIKDGDKTIGIEVRTVQDNGNNKLTVHPDSLVRKKEWQEAEPGRSLHMVILDTRVGHTYYREGAGSFRLHTLTRVRSAQHLRQLLGISHPLRAAR